VVCDSRYAIKIQSFQVHPINDDNRQALATEAYRRASKLDSGHYPPHLETARILLHSMNVSEGYTALWERGRLDLTVEALIHDNPQWHPLFTPEELAICTERLTQYEYLG
jgi:hypothetical protein